MILLGRLASLFLYADTFAGASPVGEDFVIVVVVEGGRSARTSARSVSRMCPSGGTALPIKRASSTGRIAHGTKGFAEPRGLTRDEARDEGRTRGRLTGRREPETRQRPRGQANAAGGAERCADHVQQGPFGERRRGCASGMPPTLRRAILATAGLDWGGCR